MPHHSSSAALFCFALLAGGAFTAAASAQVTFNFTNSGQQLGDDFSHSVAVGDLDGDGDLDAWVANDGEPNTMWTNVVQGACCTDGMCLQLNYQSCTKIGGTYLGGDCASVDCNDSQSLGACCVESGCDQVTQTTCDKFGGIWLEGGACDDCPKNCRADLNRDGNVDGQDLAIILSDWGLPCGE